MDATSTLAYPSRATLRAPSPHLLGDQVQVRARAARLQHWAEPRVGDPWTPGLEQCQVGEPQSHPALREKCRSDRGLGLFVVAAGLTLNATGVAHTLHWT